MTEIRFYHLLTQSPETALPRLLSRALEGGKRIVVRVPDNETAERLDEYLWTWDPDSFLAHGRAAARDDPHAADQPVWLTTGTDNPNRARTLIVTGGGASDPENYDLCCELFDGGDPAQVESARARWKRYKDSGHTVIYFRQNENGGWDKK